MIDHYALKGDELDFYRTHGYLVRSGVFNAAEVGQLQASVEVAVATACQQAETGKTYHLDGKRFVDVDTMTVQFEHGRESTTARVIEPAHHLNDELTRLVQDARLVDPVKTILGCDQISIWTNKLNLKRAEEGSGFGWHQDSPYWVHDSDHVDLLPNVYLAFDDATEENGCLRVIDGSHLQGCLPGTNDGTQLGGFFTDPSCFDEADAVSLTLAAGDIAFFDPHCIHGSNPNRSSESRRAMVLTYQPADFPMLKTRRVYNIDKARHAAG